MPLIRSLLVIALGLAAGSTVIAAPQDVLVPNEQRTPAPKVVFSDIPGARRHLLQFKGKIVVVNFWATWCVPCQVEMPEFVKTYPAYRDRGVEFVGAASEPRSNKAKVREFVQGMQIDFPIWLEASEEHLSALGVGPAIPSTVIVDGQGRIAARITGTTDSAQLRDLLDRLLSEKASSAQQSSTTRAGWPCGARLDASYFQVAEGSGGHLLLLAPEEIGDSAALLTAFGSHSQTIFRLAGALNPGVHEFQVPIDSTVESALFSISVQCLQVADVIPPSGGFASREGVTDLSNFRAERMVIVTRPERGIWTLRVSGSGIGGIVVQARSTIGIGRAEFASPQGAAFAAMPSPGVENTVRIRLSGDVTEVKGSLVNGALKRIAALPGEAGETPDSYVSRFTPGSEGFRLLIVGKDREGFAVQRMTAPLISVR